MSYYLNGITKFDSSLNYTPQGAQISIICNTVSGLPTVATVQSDHGITPIIGSSAFVVNSSETYVMNSNGDWILQTPPEWSNIYTKAQIDYMIQTLSGVIGQMQTDISAISPGFFQLGTVISDGTDLNDLTTPGVYISTSGDHTGTLFHCPVSSSPFRLEVKYTAITSRYIQTLQAGASNIYTRNKYTDTTPQNTGWNHWYRFSGTDTGA